MWPNPQLPPDLVTFTEELLNGKLHFLCNVFEVSNNNALAFIQAVLIMSVFEQRLSFFKCCKIHLEGKKIALNKN